MKHRSIIISIIAVLALGLMGYGYAAWSATVTTTAPISTGTFALGVAAPGAVGASGIGTGTTDEGTTGDLTWNGTVAGTIPSTYNVGSLIDANGATPATNFTSGYYTSVTEAYANVYPDYQAGYTVDIKNGGTIPIDLQTPSNTWAGDTTVAADYDVYSWTLTDVTVPASPVLLAQGTTNDMSSIDGKILPAGDLATLTVNAYFNDDPATHTGAVTLAQGETTAVQTISILGNQYNH